MLLAPFLWIFCEFDEKVLDNLSLGTIVFVLILVAGRIIKYDGFWPRLLIAIAPLFLSIVMSYFKNKDGE